MPFQTIETHNLCNVSGGAGAWDTVKSGAQTAWEGVKTGANTVRNFGNGFAGGATFGVNAKTSQIEMYGNKSQPGFGAGVESGMMFNQALGPAGRLISTAAGGVTTGAGGGQ